MRGQGVFILFALFVLAICVGTIDACNSAGDGGHAAGSKACNGTNDRRCIDGKDASGSGVNVMGTAALIIVSVAVARISALWST